VRRAAGALAVLAVLAAGAFALLQVVNARDDAEVATPAAAGPGEVVETRCPARRRDVTRDRRALGDQEIATALARGNVVLVASEPAALARVQEAVSGPFDAELAAAGQMVILARGDGAGVTALAFGRRLRAASPDDPELRAFAEAHLGSAAGRRCD
jgi:hypothetical protein